MKQKKIPFKLAKVKGSKAIKLRKQKEKTGDVVDDPVVDKFIDENTEVDPDSAYVPPATENDLRDELSHLEGFRDYAQESRGNTLSYGDY
jgi:hypothetical protein